MVLSGASFKPLGNLQWIRPCKKNKRNPPIYEAEGSKRPEDCKHPLYLSINGILDSSSFETEDVSLLFTFCTKSKRKDSVRLIWCSCICATWFLSLESWSCNTTDLNQESLGAAGSEDVKSSDVSQMFYSSVKLWSPAKMSSLPKKQSSLC